MKRGGLVFIAGGLASFYCKIGEYFRRIRILASRRRSVRLGSDSLAAARSHSGSDSRPRLSFIALVPLRYVKGCHSLPSPFESACQKEKVDSNSRSSTLLGQARL